MPQSSVIFFYLAIGFIIFIVSRGELPAYLSIFVGTATPAPTPQQSSQASGNNSINVSDIATIAQVAALA